MNSICSRKQTPYVIIALVSFNSTPLFFLDVGESSTIPTSSERVRHKYLPSYRPYLLSCGSCGALSYLIYPKFIRWKMFRSSFFVTLIGHVLFQLFFRLYIKSRLIHPMTFLSTALIITTLLTSTRQLDQPADKAILASAPEAISGMFITQEALVRDSITNGQNRLKLVTRYLLDLWKDESTWKDVVNFEEPASVSLLLKTCFLLWEKVLRSPEVKRKYTVWEETWRKFSSIYWSVTRKVAPCLVFLLMFFYKMYYKHIFTTIAILFISRNPYIVLLVKSLKAGRKAR